MSRRKPNPTYTVDALSEGGRPVRIVTREVDSADAISQEISRGARVRNPLGEVVSALAPAALLALGTAATRRPATRALPPGELPAYVVYTPGKGGRAREAIAFAPEWAERARELEKVGTLVADYDLLLDAFGEPIPADQVWDDEKTQAIWLIEFGRGDWATVYDYNTTLPPEHNDVWNVAGWDPKVLDFVQATVTAGVPGATEVVPENALVANSTKLKRRLMR